MNASQRDTPLEKCSCYSIHALIPEKAPQGKYEILLHNGFGDDNGWFSGGMIEIEENIINETRVFNVVDFGAKPNENADSTNGILYAIHQAEAAGGGTVYFPRGRYRIDCPKKSSFPVPFPLEIPPGVSLKGESKELVSLFFPERKTPLSCLIKGSDNFKIEDLTIYTQGKHGNIINGGSNVEINRIRIRANCCYRVGTREAKYEPANYREHQKLGYAIDLNSNNFQITDCDIYHSGSTIHLTHCEYGLISGNKLCHSCNYLMAQGCRKIIFENNECRSNNLFAHGGSWAIGDGKWIENLYFANNRSFHHYGADRENITTDNHGTAYLGKIQKVDKNEIIFKNAPEWGVEHKDMIPDWNNTCIYILAGKGAGQYRKITGCHGRVIQIKTPFAVEPDEKSLISIGVYNGRNLFIGNCAEDAGSVVQLYPPNCECIITANESRRGGNFSAGGMLTSSMPWGGNRVEPSWYNQFLGNVVSEGNAWGDGGETCAATINGVLGGATALNIYGANIEATEAKISRWHVIRKHQSENNGFIRIGGNVSDVIVENCEIKNNQEGIRLESVKETDIAGTGNGPNFRPEQILVINCTFRNVNKHFTGDAELTHIKSYRRRHDKGGAWGVVDSY